VAKGSSDRGVRTPASGVDPDHHRVDDTAGSEALDDAILRERPEPPAPPGRAQRNTTPGEQEMNRKDTNPSANVPLARPDEPRGDRGQGNTTWIPDSGEQGISNRADDDTDADEEGDSEEQDEGEEVGE
jgi:hypothetical protein